MEVVTNEPGFDEKMLKNEIKKEEDTHDYNVIQRPKVNPLSKTIPAEEDEDNDDELDLNTKDESDSESDSDYESEIKKKRMLTVNESTSLKKKRESFAYPQQMQLNNTGNNYNPFFNSLNKPSSADNLTNVKRSNNIWGNVIVENQVAENFKSIVGVDGRVLSDRGPESYYRISRKRRFEERQKEHEDRDNAEKIKSQNEPEGSEPKMETNEIEPTESNPIIVKRETVTKMEIAPAAATAERKSFKQFTGPKPENTKNNQDHRQRRMYRPPYRNSNPFQNTNFENSSNPKFAKKNIPTYSISDMYG